MFKHRFATAVASAALCAMAYAAPPVHAASLLSSAVAVEHPFTGFDGASTLDGRYGSSVRSVLSVPQFDPIFGTLTEVRLHVDTTFDFEVPFSLAGFSPGGFIWRYAGFLAIGAEGINEAIVERAGGETRLPSGSKDILSVSDRDITTLSTGPAGWSGVGTREIVVLSEQDALFNPSFGSTVSYEAGAFDEPPSEIINSIAVEYVFDPGVQTVNTSLGLLSFSSAFRPDVVLTRSGATVVPVPAALPLSATALAGLALLRARRARG